MPISPIPQGVYPSVPALDPKALRAKGITLVLADLDNTLAPYKVLEPDPEVAAWKEALEREGIQLFILSNSRKPGRAQKYAEALGRKYEDMNLVVAHLGGGISISAHSRGRIIDSVSDDAGPFSPDRSGSLNMLYVVDLCYSGKYTKKEMLKKLRGEGGMSALLGTHDCQEIERRIENGDEWTALVYKAQALQIAKGVGIMLGCFTELIDAVILTGGIAHNEFVVRYIEQHCSFIAPVSVYPGENELESLVANALVVLRGTIVPKVYA